MEKGRWRFSVAEILLWAFIFRLIFLFREPLLSDDIYRYVWDGIMVAHIKNPYLHAPAYFIDMYLPANSADILSRVNHPAIGTVYPPVAQIFFGMSQLFTHGVVPLKAMLTIMDIFSCLLLSRLARRQWLTIIYAWNPVAVIECGASGHVDILMVFFLLLSLYMLKQERFSLSGLFLGLSVLSKVIPIIFFPFFLDDLWRRYSFKTAANFTIYMALAAAIITLPFINGLPELIHNLVIYASRWEFSGLLYNSLKPVWGSETARLILSTFFALTLLILIFIKTGLYQGCILSFSAYLLTTATVHPWYILPVVSMLPLVPVSSGFILSWSAFMPYFTMIDYSVSGTWKENPLMTTILFCAMVAVFIHTFTTSRLSGQDIQQQPIDPIK